MNFHEFWLGLNAQERENFAEKSGYKQKHIAVHLAYGRKTPPLRKIKKLADASNGKLDFGELCDFFLERDNPQQPKTP